MHSSDLSLLTITEARKKLDSREISAVELAQACLDSIKGRNNELNAYLEVFDDVLAQAEAADARIQAGESLPLLGIPLAIKDNILIKGRKATSASKILEGYVAPYDATAIAKLKAQGAVFMGRVNMDEFAMGGSTENSAFGVTRNPHDPARVAGGSSGGSAAALAMHGCLAALGSDTGGSVRQPASFCGVVGLKPTYGRVSRYGLMAMGSSLDQIGPITRSAEDAEIILNAIKGRDAYDGTTYADDTYPVYELKKTYAIGIPQSLVNSPAVGEDVRKNFNEVLEKLRGLGHSIVDIEIPNMDRALAVYYILMPAEVSSNLSRFDGVKYGLHVDGGKLLDDYLETRGQGFGAEARRRILLGTYVLSKGYYDAFYGKALAAQKLLQEEFAKASESVDFILTPTAPTPAWTIGEKEGDPLAAYLADIFTVTANIVGCPAICVPSGFSPTPTSELPLGVQFMAPHNAEARLCDIAAHVQNPS